MTSLKRQLFVWLLPLYIVTAVVAMMVSYRQYETNIGAFMDGQLHGLANSHIQQITLSKRLPVLPSVDEQHSEHDGTPIVQFWSSDGRLISGSRPVPGLTLQSADGPRDVEADESWRVYTLLASPISVQLVQSNAFRHRVMWHSAWKSAEPIAILIPLSIVLLWFAVHRSLRPLGRLVHTISEKDERDFAELPIDRSPKEIAPLLVSMNGLLKRLQMAFATQQRFVQDAAHELRTPLAALVLQAERLRAKWGDTSNEELDRLEAGIQRLHRLVTQLLRLERQESLARKQELSVIEIGNVLKDSITDLLPLADQRRIDIGCRISEVVRLRADVNDLRSVFDNLLDNALRYTPAGGAVDITLMRQGDGFVVDFLDTGPGIPPALLERAFDRFYRVLGQSAPGSGLGLAIARSAALRSGMRIELQNRSDRSGLLARAHLPRST
ncbi:ATP-binding protein [Dyella sp.]|jgi:signal transduction histidine kinase|uniref:ATP-binding protein n=1 Tax=Dyella sp. TaxID=1869338 RepID=UPI002FDA5983